MDEGRPTDTPGEAAGCAGPARAAGRIRLRRTAVGVAVPLVLVAGLGACTVSGGSDDSLPTSPAAADTGSTSGDADGKRRAGDDCASADAELFAQLSSLVPEVRGATPRPLSESTYCPGGARGVEVDVSDGKHRGVLRVLLSPPGSLGGGSSIQTSGGSISTSTVSVRGGGSLSLTSQSAGRGAAPFEHELDDLSDELARRNAHS